MPAYVLEITTLALGLVLLLAEAFIGPTKKRCIAHGAIIGLSVVLVMLFFVVQHAPETSGFWSFYTADKLALFYKGISLLCTIIVLIISLDYAPVLEQFSARAGGGPAIGEFFALPVFICTGMMWMASAIDLTSIFVSLELITIAFYVMVGYQRKNRLGLEASVKYLVLGALSTGFLVYGLSWLFGVTGQTNLAAISEALNVTEHANAALFALSLILVGLAFKVAAVPFQFWVPDVYQGAPTPVTAFLSVGSKSAGFIIGFRLLEPFLNAPGLGHTTLSLLAALAGATLLVGNFAAIPQINFKRLLAYSSISHAGFLLLALASARPILHFEAPAIPTSFGTGASAGVMISDPMTPASVLDGHFSISPIQVVSFYLASYLIMTLLSFTVLAIINRVKGSDDLTAFDGLAKRSPFLAFAMLISAVSLAGVPLTAGFLGKFFVFSLAVDAGHLWPTIIAVIGAVAGFYYYLKVVRAMYWNATTETAAISISPLTRVTIIVLVIATIFFGIYPQPILSLLQ